LTEVAVQEHRKAVRAQAARDLRCMVMGVKNGMMEFWSIGVKGKGFSSKPVAV
jgi:hypothetical protein